MNSDAWESGADTMAWTADQPIPNAPDASNAAGGPRMQPGRPGRMTYLPWSRSQRIDLGASARDQHYWRCPVTGCRKWAGPYPNPVAAKRDAINHRHHTHDHTHDHTRPVTKETGR